MRSELSQNGRVDDDPATAIVQSKVAKVGHDMRINPAIEQTSHPPHLDLTDPKSKRSERINTLEQLLPSVTVTLYVPATTPLKSSVVAPLFHR